MKALLILLALCTVPAEDNVIVDNVDHIELNHNYDRLGKHMFDQLIFWEYRYKGSYIADRTVIDYVLVGKNHNKYEVKNNEVILFHGGVIRKIIYETFQETWTQYDPELLNREVIPQINRPKLTSPKKPIGNY